MGNWYVSKPDNDGERELLDMAVKALEAEFATKTCNKQIASKLEDAEMARDSEETCNNKQVISKLVASEDERMTREEIKNIPKLVDYMLDKCVLADSRTKLCKRLKEVCDMAIKALEQEPCDDTISRQEALNCFKINNTKGDVWYAIKELPPVTPKQRTGHWILVSDKTPGGYWKCSECLMHKRMPGRLDSFCSCCGADMRESEEQA